MSYGDSIAVWHEAPGIRQVPSLLLGLTDPLNRRGNGHAGGSEDGAATPVGFVAQKEAFTLVLDLDVWQGLQIAKDFGPFEFVALKRQAVVQFLTQHQRQKTPFHAEPKQHNPRERRVSRTNRRSVTVIAGLLMLTFRVLHEIENTAKSRR